MTQRESRSCSKFSDIIERMKSAREVAAQSVQNVGDAVTQGAKSVGEATSQGARTVGESVDSIRQRSPWDSVLPEQVQDNLLASIELTGSLSRRTKRRLTAQMASALDSLSMDHVSTQAQAFTMIQGLLASDQISREINSWLQGLVPGQGYDIDVDLNYQQTAGSDYTLAGASQSSIADDGIYEESIVLIEELAPYDASSIGISVSWVNDLVSYDFVELIAGSIGILAVALNWNNDDVEDFSRLVGSIGLSSVASTNPLTLIVTLVALARAFHLARKSGDWKEFSDGIAKGGICVGAVLLATSLINGPAVIILLTGVCVGILANQATKNVSFVEIGGFMVSKMREFPPIVGSAAASAEDATPTST